MPPSRSAAAFLARLLTLVALPAVVAMTGPAAAQQEPRGPTPPALGAQGPGQPVWEAGIFAAGGWVADYPASGEGRWRGLPVPYVIYRGETIRIGDQGAIRARRTFLDDRLELDIGLGGAFDVDSDDSEARRGMPDLDFLFEAGPSIEYRFLPVRSPVQVQASLEVRAVFSTDFSDVDYQGFVVNPQIGYFNRSVGGSPLSLFAAVGPVWGFDGMNDYFYTVEPRYARPGRPAYRADEGYIGTEFTLGLSYRITGRLRAFAGGQIGYFGGAANADSPLFEEEVNYSVGFGLNWTLYESERRTRS